jgi:IclR family pca regulon transcriptional regulator
VLDKLADRTRQSASLGLLLDQEVLIIARSTGQRTLSTGLGIGSRLPAFCSAIGRAVLSTLPRADVVRYLTGTSLDAYTRMTVRDVASAADQVEHCRDHGWAECDEELELGVRCIAVPVSSLADKTIAAVSLSVRAERMTMNAFRQAHLAAILEARDELKATVNFE